MILCSRVLINYLNVFEYSNIYNRITEITIYFDLGILIFKYKNKFIIY